MYGTDLYSKLFCAFSDIGGGESSSSSSKIKYCNSTAQVVCDKAPLSASQSAVIASVPHLCAPSINSAKKLSEKPICKELNHSLEHGVARPHPRRIKKKHKKKRANPYTHAVVSFGSCIQYRSVSRAVRWAAAETERAHACLINIFFELQSKQPFIFLNSISSVDVWRLIYV